MAEMMAIKRRKRRKHSGWKKIHQSALTELDGAISSGADLKSNGGEENRQGSCCPEETPSSSIHPSVQRPHPASQRLKAVTQGDLATRLR